MEERPKPSLEAIRAEYDRLDAITGVDTSGVEIKFSSRSVRRYGYCKYKNWTPVLITIAAFLLDDEEQFWDTVRHEYAHALVKLRAPKEKHGHDKVWKAACIEIGCRPERLVPSTAESKARREANAKYIVECRDCLRRWTYLKRGRVVDGLLKGRRLTCPCGSHELTLKEVKK